VLRGRSWDAVIDTSGYLPRQVRATGELLAPSVGQYVFISTIAVYRPRSVLGIAEDAPLETLPPTVDPELYEM